MPRLAAAQETILELAPASDYPLRTWVVRFLED